MNHLHSITDLTTELSRVKSGECLIINPETGRVFTGIIPAKVSEKFKPIAETKAGKNPVKHLDGNGKQEFINTKTVVQSPGNAFKNFWDNVALKQPKNFDNPMFELFNEAMENLDPKQVENIKINTITGQFVSYKEIVLPDFPVIYGFYSKTGTMAYYIYNGIKHE